MKNLLLNLLLITTVSCGSFAQEESMQIGMIKGDGYEITLDTDFIKEKFDKRLDMEGYKTKITDVKITSAQYEDRDESYYMLVGANKDRSIKIGTSLTLQNKRFYGGFANTVTCNGCAVGCHPAKSSDGFNVCWPTCGNDCSKTETAN